MLKSYPIRDPPMYDGMDQRVTFLPRGDPFMFPLDVLPQPLVPINLQNLPEDVKIERSTIVLGPVIGTGHFGIVYKAEMESGDGKFDPIAVKTLKNEWNLADNSKASDYKKSVKIKKNFFYFLTKNFISFTFNYFQFLAC